MIKKEARNYINQHFSSLSKKEKINLDAKILKNFKKNLNILNCKNIGSYVSLNNEVSTFNLNQFISEKGINVFLPKLSKNKKNKHLSFLQYLKKDKHTKNTFGVLEPSSNMKSIELEELDLIVVPIRAVNKNLIRLGYGGGFYDASLKRINPKKCIGLGYEFQIIEDFEIESHDLKLGGLITPEGYFKNAL